MKERESESKNRSIRKREGEMKEALREEKRRGKMKETERWGSKKRDEGEGEGGGVGGGEMRQGGARMVLTRMSK